MSIAESKSDWGEVARLIEYYDATWSSYEALQDQYPQLATLYDKLELRRNGINADKEVNRLRESIKK